MPRELNPGQATGSRRIPAARVRAPTAPPQVHPDSLTCDAFVFDPSHRAVATVVGEPARKTWDTILTFDGWMQTRQLPAATRELLHVTQSDMLAIATEAGWGSVEVGRWCRERWPDLRAWENIVRVLPRFPAATGWRLVVRAIVW